MDVFATELFRANMESSASSNNVCGVEGAVKISSVVRSMCGLLLLVCAGSLLGAEPPSLTINDVSVSEGNHGVVVAVFTVSLSKASEEEVTVRYATVDDSAKAGTDFTAAKGVATITAGKTSAQVVVQVRSNRIENPERSFSVELTDALGAAVARGAGRGTIVDDDQGGTPK